MTEPIQPARLKKLLRRLIDLYSPSGKEEDILDFLHGYFKRRDLPVEKQQVDGKRYNLIVAPPDVDIQLGLVGHVDTIEAYDYEHYEFEEDGDEIAGLGAADMKAGCAAMIEAYLCAWKTDKPPVALCLVVGEEAAGDGAIELVKDYDFPWAVIGEPTDLKPCLSTYGYMEIQLATQGRRVHASLANQVTNPIESMLHLVLNIVRHFAEAQPELIYNLRDLFSAQAGFYVPELCEAWIDVHMPPALSIPAVMQELEDLMAREKKTNPEFDATVRFPTVDAGFEIPEKGPMVESLREVYQRLGLEWAPAPFPSHSDATRFWEAGVRPIILGPGRLEKAHAPEESVSFEQVVAAANIYADLIRSFKE